MNTKKILLLLAESLFIILPLFSKDVWDKPFNQWNRGEILKILNNSPWAHVETIGSAMERDLESGRIGDAGAGARGERENFNKFTIRFFSALPIREAYVRMFQISNNYDQMMPEQRQEFDARFNRALGLDVKDRVIVAVDFASSDPDTNRDMKHFFDISTAETLKQDVYLISQGLGRIELKEYYPPSPDGTGAKFVFPRTINGTAIVQAGDREINLEFYVPPVDQKLLVKFKAAQLSYRGELNY